MNPFRSAPWRSPLALVLPLVTLGPLHADPVEVVIRGTIEFNQVTAPPLGLMTPGQAIETRFTVDSDVFVDSASFPTRGYPIDLTSFALTFGLNSVPLQIPFPAGETPYFVLRDNDPAVDGFFVATSVDFPIGVPLNQTGLFGQFEHDFSVTYGGGTLSSLDLLPAAGVYDFTGLSVFNWTVNDGGFQPIGLLFSTLEILPQPPAGAFCFGVACPCGNDSPTTGCLNSTGTGAVASIAGGSTSVFNDNLVLLATGLPPDNSGLWFSGTGIFAPMDVDDGLGCTGGLFRYVPGTVSPTGEFSITNVVGQAPFGSINAGDTVYFQAWTRDVLCGPPPAPCPSPCGMGSNLSSGISAAFTP